MISDTPSWLRGGWAGTWWAPLSPPPLRQLLLSIPHGFIIRSYRLTERIFYTNWARAGAVRNRNISGPERDGPGLTITFEFLTRRLLRRGTRYGRKGGLEGLGRAYWAWSLCPISLHASSCADECSLSVAVFSKNQYNETQQNFKGGVFGAEKEKEQIPENDDY